MSGSVCVMLGSSPSTQVIITPPAAEYFGESSFGTTNYVTASVSQGSGFNFVWSYVSGDPDVTPNLSLTGAVQSWSATLSPSQDRFSHWRVSAYLGSVFIASEDIFPTLRRL